MASLKSMNREQLNAEATRLGIADVEQLKTNDDVINAIEGSDAYKAEQEEAAKAKASADAKAQAEAEAAQPKTTYIVGGVEVDPNGNPVKG